MIKNQELANQILEMINTAIEASQEMQQYLENEQLQEFQEVFEGLYLLNKSIQGVADDLKKEESGLSLPAATESIKISLVRIQTIVKKDLKRAIHKIEFELIPLIEEMRVNFYFWGMTYPDAAKMQKYYKKDIHWLAENKYQTESAKTGVYKYELSIVVIAYNKLNYTQQCVASLLKNLPKEITYELILLNHGSNDGTQEFFEKIHPHKQLDIAINGGGSGAVQRIVEGKYLLSISNDVLVTKDAIKNMYACITSDEKIAFIVPTTPNVSNLQTISAKYSSMEELEDFAIYNNILNPNRWEQRVRLCNPISMTNSFCNNYLKQGYWFHSKNRYSFPDDRHSLLSRRNGYKLYLVKDAYCHHFGSVTLKSDANTNSAEAYLQGRRDFYQAFGVDPWGTGFCFSPYLFNRLRCDKTGKVSILGINCGLGSNSLKIKEELKERLGNTDVTLKNITTDARYVEDLSGISDEAEYVQEYKAICNDKAIYDYILAEAISFKGNELLKAIKLFTEKTAEDGVIIVAITGEEKELLIAQQKELLDTYNEVVFVPENAELIWMIMYK